MIWARLKARFLKKCNVKWYCSSCQVLSRFAKLTVKRCISAAAFGRMAGVLTSIDRSSSTFLFWNENMIFSWRILMRVFILVLPVVLGWVSGVATPSRDACRGYSDGLTNFNSYRCMYVRRFFVFPLLTFALMFWYNRVTGCVGSSVRRSGTGTGCLRGTLRLSGTKLILDIIWTCATHVH